MSDDILRGIGRLEGKMDQVIEWTKSHAAEDRANFSDLSNRLGKVEKKTWAAGGIISLVVAYFTAKLSGH